MDYKETIKKRLDELSPELRAFVVDESWRREAEKIGKQFNLSEEKYASFENEIFLVLLCFEPPTDFAENIKRELEMEANTAGWIAEDVNKNIFSKIANEIDEMWKVGDAGNIGDTEQSERTEGSSQLQNNIGNDFEQIILNQAKAMQPAQDSSKQQVVSSKEEEPKAIHNYMGESDPYRESIQ